jgi:hypothetical protein
MAAAQLSLRRLKNEYKSLLKDIEGIAHPLPPFFSEELGAPPLTLPCVFAGGRGSSLPLLAMLFSPHPAPLAGLRSRAWTG